MIVTLIRHTSVDVPKGMFYGQTDVPLNPSFHEEAAVVLKDIENETFDKVYTSPLSRCVKLAAFCGFPDAVHDDRIKELDFGDWEMKQLNDIKDAQLEDWFKDYFHVPATNGESFMMQYERVSSFMNELKEKGFSQVAVFTHGGVIICAQLHFGTLTPDEAFASLTPYGGIVKMII